MYCSLVRITAALDAPNQDAIRSTDALPGTWNRGAYHRLGDHTEKLHDSAVCQKRHDKTECNYDTEQCTTEIHDGCSGISGNDHFRSDLKYNHHCKNSSDDLGYQIQRCGGKRSCQIMILTDPLRFCKIIIGTHDCRYDQDNYDNVA